MVGFIPPRLILGDTGLLLLGGSRGHSVPGHVRSRYGFGQWMVLELESCMLQLLPPGTKGPCGCKASALHLAYPAAVSRGKGLLPAPVQDCCPLAPGLRLCGDEGYSNTAVLASRVFSLSFMSQQRFRGEGSSFQMFDSATYSGKNLLFKDSTTALVPITNQTYQAWLGEEYLHAMQGLGCDPSSKLSLWISLRNWEYWCPAPRQAPFAWF